jgi:hypothetical protein
MAVVAVATPARSSPCCSSCRSPWTGVRPAWRRTSVLPETWTSRRPRASHFQLWQQATAALKDAETRGAPHAEVVRLSAEVIRARNVVTVDRLQAGWHAPDDILCSLPADDQLLREKDDVADPQHPARWSQERQRTTAIRSTGYASPRVTSLVVPDAVRGHQGLRSWSCVDEQGALLGSAQFAGVLVIAALGQSLVVMQGAWIISEALRVRQA